MAVSRRYVKWVNILLGTLFLLPVMAALIVYKGGAEHLRKVNKGTLISPMIASKNIAFRSYDAKPVSFQKKWTVLYHVSDCEKTCEKILDKVLRVRLALGKDMSRTQAALVTNSKVPTRLLNSMSEVRQLDTQALLLSDSTLDLDQIYLIDPLGNIMMRYDASAHPKDIYSDITRLLKVSTIG